MKKKIYYSQTNKVNEESATPSPLINTSNIKLSAEKKAEFEKGQVLLIDKPLHWTSFDVVRKVRNCIQIKKVGHAGTLDPLATGLLILCTGKFTKKINEFMAQEKEYTGSFTVGFTTPTFDLESDPENEMDIAHLSDRDILQATDQFKGVIDQFPPMYSAIKKNGTRLYELARRGDHVELEARKVTITSFEITAIDLPVIYFKIVCSTGTYIRSIANDFGKILGCGAYLSGLRRTAIGDQRVENAITMDKLIQLLSSESVG